MRTVHIIHVQIHESIHARNIVNVFDTWGSVLKRNQVLKILFTFFSWTFSWMWKVMEVFYDDHPISYSNIKANIEYLLFQRSSITHLSLYTSLNLIFDSHKSNPLNTIVCLEFLLSMVQNLTNIGICSSFVVNQLNENKRGSLKATSCLCTMVVWSLKLIVEYTFKNYRIVLLLSLPIHFTMKRPMVLVNRYAEKGWIESIERK